MEKLSTGKKINSAAEGASGLAITTRMTSQIQGAATAISNACDAINMVMIADAALIEIESMLQRVRELRCKPRQELSLLKIECIWIPSIRICCEA